MNSAKEENYDDQEVIRYRGFLLLRETNKSWLVRPERSPMAILPFRTSICSVDMVKRILDNRLSKLSNIQMQQAA